MERRTLLSLLSIGAAQFLVGCSSGSIPPGQPTQQRTPPTGGPTRPTGQPAQHPAPLAAGASGPADQGATVGSVSMSSGPALPPIPPPHPGPPKVVFQAPGQTRRIALTIDDGYAPEVVAAYVAFAQRSGIPITFQPNGCYEAIWGRHAAALRPLIEAGQVQIGNHTWTHRNLLARGRADADIRADVERNEEWIQRTFGITSRPWFRPPYGSHNSHVDGVVAEIGYTNIMIWNGSFGDSAVLTPEQLMNEARRYLQPGTIMLGHANHPTITGLFDQVQELIEQRQLEPVTLDTMFGTSRATG
ncbi:polysaccharide deacetylase [Frankia sp. CcI49]|uniref:polysaccharide deacetylase family protein n=1 Tax=unclassified Frankia TaxID=2632575 RepID=UPI0006CA54B5|nr:MULTISPECIES: polysaccharide deacetylase family protein [unclassified Frankia]KPM52470.1 polysaccharide deacetylase [Frankia sp. R43]ONH59814.1 polysaccharide deacetylase [Frankia sp. CcI49]